MIHPDNRLPMAGGPLEKEESVKEKIDSQGNTWAKVYFGSGAHFKNWLSQVQELYDEKDIEVEEVTNTGLTCYEESGEKAFRIWVKKHSE